MGRGEAGPITCGRISQAWGSERSPASMDYLLKGADWAHSQSVAYLGRTPLGVCVGECFNQGLPDTLILRRRAHVLLLGGLGSRGGRQSLGHLDSSGHGCVFRRTL